MRRLAHRNQHVRSQVDASELTYDTDGNLTQDDRFVYAYDAENRLVSVYPISPTEGALAVINIYDHDNRRVVKRVERFHEDAWMLAETHTFVYEGNNIVFERIVGADGSERIVEYFRGNDLSGSEQGAGGVGGLLAVSIDGSFYVPCYDQIGNVVCYVSESGAIAAQFVYDPYGNVIDQYGNMPDQFAFGFSTKYLDRETGLIGYQHRFYNSAHGCWFNRDPIGEDGGDNLYVFCLNNPAQYFDVQGTVAQVLIPLGAAAAKAAAEAAIAAAAAAAAAIAAELLKKSCPTCRPCDPPVGTIMYEIHVGHSHVGFDPHVHYHIVQQSPPLAGCRCFAPKVGFVGGNTPMSGAIPYRYPGGGGF